MGALATFSGVALVPGLSRNNRLYTPEIINKAAKRMHDRLSDPNGLPIVMRTHHEAGDDSARIVGRVTSVNVDNESALRYKAELFDTSHGRDIAQLVKPKDGKQTPALRSVSIHGYWMGEPRSVTYEGEHATTADDLEIDAIDFTATPGVGRALIDAGGKAKESVDGVRRVPISESMDATISLVEEDSGWADITGAAKKGGWSTMRGFQYEKDMPDRWWIYEAKYSADDMKSLLSKGHAMKNDSGEPSYPIADVADLRKAIKAVGRGKANHNAIRKHIMKRAKALGQSGLIPANWNADGSMKENTVRLGDVTEYFMESPEAAGFCIDAYAGPLSVSVRGCVSPDQLRAAAQAAATAAMDAINAMDPDADADIDVGDMGEQGTSAVGGAIPDDSMTDKYGESLATGGHVPGPGKSVDAHTISINVKPVMDETAIELIRKQLDDLRERLAPKPVADEAAMPPGDGHTHTHDGMDGHTHAHAHDHVNDGGKTYTHGHTHTHVHGSMDDGGGDHTHGHDHVHVTSPSATAETIEQVDNTLEESAMGDTQETAAEAAPKTPAFTAEDMKVLGETIGGLMAEAIRALGESNAPKHAATTQETAEQAAPSPVAENVPEDVAEKAPQVDMGALKESLAKELRKEIRDDLRAELLKENGLPPRRGYRLSENDEDEVQLTDAELFDKHRVEMLLGSFAKTPAPGDAA